MKRRIVVLILLLLLLAIAAVWFWRSRPEPRQPDVYYDFSARLAEARIEDQGFLGLCWKEPLEGNWSEDSREDGRVQWSREIEMPLEWDPQVLLLEADGESWNRRFPSEDPRSATWSVEYGRQVSREFEFKAASLCWAATEQELPLGQAIFWIDGLWNRPSAAPLELSIRANGTEVRRVLIASYPGRHYEWPFSVLEESIRFEFVPSEMNFSPEDVTLRAGLTFPSRILLDVPARDKKFDPNQLVLYYRPKEFSGLLPWAKWLGQLPEDVPRSPAWLTAGVKVGEINRRVFRLLPGQKIRFPLWMMGDSELRVACADQLSRPLLRSSTGQLQLAIVPEASPATILWKQPLPAGQWKSPSEWEDETLSLEKWTGTPVELELSFQVGQAQARFSPAMHGRTEFPFAYVALEPLSTTYSLDLSRPSIILFGADTLRVDRLSCYGYKPRVNPNLRTTPNLDALARVCTRYERAYSPSSFTLPVFASMFTSRYPSAHTAYIRYQSLPESVETLAEILQAQGYQTAAFVDQGFMDPAYGMNQGFELYDNQDGRLVEIGPRALKWLKQRDPNRPFFLFLHFYDTHAPYYSPEEIRFRYSLNPGYNRLPQIVQEVHPYWLKVFREENTPLTREDYEHMSALYDASVTWMDINAGKFLAGVDQMQLLGRSMIVFAADHGECFGERGQLAHGETLNEQLVHVPFLIKWPGGLRPGNVIRTPVSLLDIAPTILDAAGIPIPPAWQGISLCSTQAGNEPTARVLYAQLPGDHRFMALDFPYKLMLDTTSGAPIAALHQVVEDPLEEKDIAPFNVEKTEVLMELLTQHLEKTPPLTRLARQAIVSPELMDNLRDLGYVGGQAAAAE
jgi:arylsulfatase